MLAFRGTPLSPLPPVMTQQLGLLQPTLSAPAPIVPGQGTGDEPSRKSEEVSRCAGVPIAMLTGGLVGSEWVHVSCVRVCGCSYVATGRCGKQSGTRAAHERAASAVEATVRACAPGESTAARFTVRQRPGCEEQRRQAPVSTSTRPASPSGAVDSTTGARSPGRCASRGQRLISAGELDDPSTETRVSELDKSQPTHARVAERAGERRLVCTQHRGGECSGNAPRVAAQ